MGEETALERLFQSMDKDGDGAVTKEVGTKLVKICVDGKIKTKTRASVGEGFPLVGRDTGEGRDCTWYGTVFCDGDTVEVRELSHVTFAHDKSISGSAQVVVPNEMFQEQVFSSQCIIC